MSEAIVDLACPKCQGKLEILDGQRIVICPYCEQRSFVKGDRGVVRYQIRHNVDYESARKSVREFWRGSNRADKLRDEARITEMFVVYLPFWASWARVAAWIFGKHESYFRNTKTPVYKEKKCLRDMHWNGPACDVAEFGVDAVQLEGRPLELYDPAALHLDGMVFQPVGSEHEPLKQAQRFFKEEINTLSQLSKISYTQIRCFKERICIVYFPLWIVRYSFLEKSYQVVVDGHSGEVLYGKVPGNPWYRSATLILAMALGIFIMIYGTFFLLNSTTAICPYTMVLSLIPMILGLKIMRIGYRNYFLGEEVEIRAVNPLRSRKGLIRVLIEDPLSLELDW